MFKGLVLLAGLFALACGPAAQQAPAGGSATDNQPKYGGTLNLAAEDDPFDWDPSYAGKSTPNQYGVAVVYSGLLRFKSGPDIEFTENVLLPDLAERWEASADAKTFTFHLRKGVKFQNLPPLNGRELTAGDVKWTLEYRSRSGELKDKKLLPGELSYMFDDLDRVETPDPHTAVVRFSQSFPPFVNYAASRWNPIMPKEIFEQDGHLKDRSIGTGPYILDTAAIQKGTRWVWKKNPNYFEAGKPYIDEIRWLILPEASSQYAAFQTKQIDLIDRLGYQTFQQVKSVAPQAQTFKYYATNAQQISLSQAPARTGSPFTDVRVRRAISMGLDRDEINKVVAGGEGLWAVPGAVAGKYSQEETRKLVKQDLEGAKRLLAEAGFNPGLELEWFFPSTEGQDNITMYQLVQSQLKRIGVNAVLKPIDLSEQRNRRRNGNFDFDAAIGGTGQLNSDLDSLIFKYHSNSSTNYVKSKDPEMDKLLETQRREPDAAKRGALMQQVSMRLLETVPVVDTIYVPRWETWQPYLKNYRPHYTDTSAYRHAWLDK